MVDNYCGYISLIMKSMEHLIISLEYLKDKIPHLTIGKNLNIVVASTFKMNVSGEYLRWK
jgi:hypothetical protein